MTKGSLSKKNAPRKRGGDVMSTAAVSMIFNGVKYRAGQKPARVCPAPAVASRPSAQERFLADVLSADADHIQQLRVAAQDAKQLVAPYRGGGKTGRRSGKVKQLHAYIRELLIEWSTWPPARLYEKADKIKIGDLSKGRFDGHVRTVISEDAARK